MTLTEIIYTTPKQASQMNCPDPESIQNKMNILSFGQLNTETPKGQGKDQKTT